MAGLAEPLAYALDFGSSPTPPVPDINPPASISQPGRSPQILNGDYVVTGATLAFVGIPGNVSSEQAYICQLVRSRLGLFQGEYLFNAQEGMPWFQSILIKGYNPNVVRGAFSNRILGTPGISSLVSLTLTFNGAGRFLSVSFSAQSNVGLISDQFTLPLTQQPQGT